MSKNKLLVALAIARQFMWSGAACAEQSHLLRVAPQLLHSTVGIGRTRVHACTCTGTWYCSNKKNLTGDGEFKTPVFHFTEEEAQELCFLKLRGDIVNKCAEFGSAVITPSYQCSSSLMEKLPPSLEELLSDRRSEREMQQKLTEQAKENKSEYKDWGKINGDGYPTIGKRTAGEMKEFMSKRPNDPDSRTFYLNNGKLTHLIDPPKYVYDPESDAAYNRLAAQSKAGSLRVSGKTAMIGLLIDLSVLRTHASPGVQDNIDKWSSSIRDYMAKNEPALDAAQKAADQAAYNKSSKEWAKIGKNIGEGGHILGAIRRGSGENN